MTTAGPPSGGGMPAAPAQYQPYPAQPAPNPGQPQYAPQENPGQQPQPQCYPPPADAQADNPAAQQPALDPYNIEYKPMEISSWRTMPAAESEYSRFWDSPDEFLPEKFIANKEANQKCNDLVWVVLFFINFAATIILLAVAFGMKNKNKDESGTTPSPPDYPPYGPYSRAKVTATGSSGSANDDVLWWALGVGFGLAVGLNIIHFLVMSFLPGCYIRGSIGVAALVVIGFSLLGILRIHWVVAILPVAWLLIASCAYCSVWGYFDLASIILGFSGRIVCKYPSIWLLFVAHGVVVFAVTIIYVITMFGIIGAGWSPWVYLYVLFSYLWVIMTLSYAVYMTIAGLAADWYFLYGTDYFPKYPMLSSLRRAFTTSFGSCCAAGLLLTILSMLKAMAHGRGGGMGGLIRCIALCIIRILECFIKFMNKYALIYCAIYGVPYVEGCRRWAELSCSRFVDVICSGLIISTVLSFTEVGLGVAAGILGFGLAYIRDGDPVSAVLTGLIAFIVALLFTMALFEVMTEPVQVISDTLLVCFAESPETLEEKESAVYTSLGTFYGNELQKYIPKEEEPETAPSTKDQIIIINNNNDSNNNNSQYMQQPQYQYQYQYPYQYGQQQQWQQPPGSQPQWQQPPGTQPQWPQQPTQQRDVESDEDESSSESHHKHHHHKKDKHKHHHHKKDKHKHGHKKHGHKKHGHKHKGHKKDSSDEHSDDDDDVLAPADVSKESADENSDSSADPTDDSEPSTDDEPSA